MEIVNLIFSENNVHTLILLVAIGSGFIWMNAKFDKKFFEIDKRFFEIDKKFFELDAKIDNLSFDLNAKINSLSSALNAKIDNLKNNDFAHLNRTIEALTFVLEKNKFLTVEN